MRRSQFIIYRHLSIALSVLGLLTAAYLSYNHLTNTTSLLCVEGGGCDTVRDSPYSEISGIPVAIVGVFGYLILIAGLLYEEMGGRLSDSIPMISFGLSLVGILYSAYLTYLEVFIIVAICPYCVASATVMLLLFALSLLRLIDKS
nr:vitamin K epoxide reductase family protein [Anaerolineae bacterium]